MKLIDPAYDLEIRLYHGWYNRTVLPDIKIKDKVILRKPHPCGGYEWEVVRLGADIGLVCCTCGHKVLLSRRELNKRLKTITNKDETNTNEN